MRLSRYLMPAVKDVPADAVLASHRLMLRSGMVHQTAAGVYSWLPLGTRVLKKIQRIVQEEQDRIGSQEVIFPTIQPASLWEESGRYDDYGKEMLRICDRHGRSMLYGPTAEEVATDVFRRFVKSYRDLPMNMYQIHWKFRDEIRPRFGVMRGREFLMKDGYSFDLTAEDGARSYEKVMQSYVRTFARMGLKAIPMKADTGPIGGNLSHEFQIIAPAGESVLYYEKTLDTLDPSTLSLETLRTMYAVTEEKYDPFTCPVSEDNLAKAHGIEVGHIFFFGTKYSAAMNACVQNKEGDTVPVEMGSYGIGVSRLVGAIIEANHDDRGIIWPSTVAPFTVGLLNLKPNDPVLASLVEDIYGNLESHGVEVLLDDTLAGAGVKFARMELIGCPWYMVVGDRQPQGYVELKNRRTLETVSMSVDDAVARVIEDACGS